MAIEVKQGIDVLFKWKAGDPTWTDFEPATPQDPDITFVYKRSIDWSWNSNLEPVHDTEGRVTHYKARIPDGTLSLSSLYTNDSDFKTLRNIISGSSVPYGYAEIQHLGVDGAVEFVYKFRRITLSSKSSSDPQEDSTVNPEFILFELPEPVLGSEKLLN